MLTRYLCVVFLACHLFAQPAQKPAAQYETAANPQMNRLAQTFLGNWTVSEDFARSRLSPRGGERKGTARFHLATGGTTLVEDYHSDGSAGKLDFMAIIWWNQDRGIYEFFTCGNGGENPCRIRGTAHWEGDSFVNEYDETMREGRKRWTDTFSQITRQSFTLVAAMAVSGGKMQPMITTKYTRRPD